MKPIHIFKTGNHTSAAGDTLEFSEDVLRAAAEAYDPALHEAPIVVGHPKDNGPAFGWIGHVTYSEKGLHADPRQINDDFAELVSKGTYKKVSASFYSPESQQNPKPGSYYLRHVGFLGGMPPAIKGLEALEFNEQDDGVIEFSADWEVAGFMRKMREFLIEKFGVDDANKAIPDYMVVAAEEAARPRSNYSEIEIEETAMTDEQIAAKEAELDERQEKLAAQEAAVAAQVAEFAEKAEADALAAKGARKTRIGAQIDDMVKAGKILPAKADSIKQFAESLDDTATVEFGEGDAASKLTSTEFLISLLAEKSTPVEFGEHGQPTGDRDDEIKTSEHLAQAALEYREERRQAGTEITITQAVNHIQGLN